MSSSRSMSKLIQWSPAIRKGIAQVKRDVLGHVPQIQERTGYQFSKKQLTGVYLNQYYTDPIAKSARQVSGSWCRPAYSIPLSSLSHTHTLQTLFVFLLLSL